MSRLALIEKTRSLIAAGDIVAAEAELMELADSEGDGALLVVLEQLPPKDVLAVIREYDDSRESVLNLLVTPDLFARAVVLERQYRDLTRSHLRGMVNSVVFRDGGEPVEFLDAIGDIEGGSEALADYFSDKWARIEGFARSGTFDAHDEEVEPLSQASLLANAYAQPRLEEEEVADRDWMQLAWTLRYRCPDLFVEVLLVLRAKLQNQLSAADTADAPLPDARVETADADRGKAIPAARESDEESAI
jgi:hypothetical protein